MRGCMLCGKCWPRRPFLTKTTPQGPSGPLTVLNLLAHGSPAADHHPHFVTPLTCCRSAFPPPGTRRTRAKAARAPTPSPPTATSSSSSGFFPRSSACAHSEECTSLDIPMYCEDSVWGLMFRVEKKANDQHQSQHLEHDTCKERSSEYTA